LIFFSDFEKIKHLIKSLYQKDFEVLFIDSSVLQKEEEEVEIFNFLDKHYQHLTVRIEFSVNFSYLEFQKEVEIFLI
jgi:signal recognition particle receptor subunit beta